MSLLLVDVSESKTKKYFFYNIPNLVKKFLQCKSKMYFTNNIYLSHLIVTVSMTLWPVIQKYFKYNISAFHFDFYLSLYPKKNT